MLGHIAGYVASRTVELGLAHGLIASLASHPDGLTAEGLASDRDLDPFYVEVWCRSAFANELLERVTDKVYRLAPHMDTVLLDRGSPAYVAGTISVMSQPDVFDQFSRTLPTGRTDLVEPLHARIHRWCLGNRRGLLREVDTGWAEPGPRSLGNDSRMTPVSSIPPVDPGPGWSG